MAYSPVEHLARAISPGRNYRNVVLAMVTAYLDESENSDCCVVAGVIATAGRWDSFQSEWGRFLKKYGVSALHMKDFAHSNKEFKSWKGDTAKRDEFLRRAVEITSKRVMTGVGVVINRAAFKRTIAQYL
jgi:hypothetical protein